MGGFPFPQPIQRLHELAVLQKLLHDHAHPRLHGLRAGGAAQEVFEVPPTKAFAPLAPSPAIRWLSPMGW